MRPFRIRLFPFLPLFHFMRPHHHMYRGIRQHGVRGRARHHGIGHHHEPH